MKHHRKYAAGVGAIAFALVLTSCSGSALSGDNDTDAPSSETVKVGLTTALTGPYSEYGAPGAVGAQIAVDMFNEQEMCEQTVELVLLDDKLDAEASQSNMRRLLDEENVDFVLAPAGSGPALATLPLVQAKNKIYMNVVGQASEIVVPEGSDTPHREVFSFALGNEAESAYMLQFVEAGGYESVAIISESTPYGVGASDALEAGLDESSIDVVAVERYDQAATDLNAQLAKIAAAEADVILQIGLGADAATIRETMARLDMIDTPLLMSYASGTLSFQERVGELVEGVSTVQFQAFDGGEPSLDAARDLAIRYKEIEGNDVYYGPNEWPIPSFAGTAGPGFDAASVLLQGFATADCSVDTDTVIAALESGESFTSSRGEYSFSAEDRIAVTADVLTARTFQWNDGDIQFVSAD